VDIDHFIESDCDLDKLSLSVALFLEANRLLHVLSSMDRAHETHQGDSVQFHGENGGSVLLEEQSSGCMMTVNVLFRRADALMLQVAAGLIEPSHRPFLRQAIRLQHGI
jgi:hypothetical protein